MYPAFENLRKSGLFNKGRYWEKGINLIEGCTPVSPGCEKCWAAALAHRLGYRRKLNNLKELTDMKGRWTGELHLYPERLAKAANRRKATVYSIWNDLFHHDVPKQFQIDCLDVMRQASRHIFLVLTKRIWLASVAITLDGLSFPYNMWLGVSVCTQEEATDKIKILQSVRASRNFINFEPLLEPIDFSGIDAQGRDWVIAGAETGPNARHPDIAWFRTIRDWCKKVSIPFFLKQVDKQRTRDLDGKTYEEFPIFEV